MVSQPSEKAPSLLEAVCAVALLIVKRAMTACYYDLEKIEGAGTCSIDKDDPSEAKQTYFDFILPA